MSSMIENFDSLARLLLEALLNTLWQGMLIAVLVWLLLRLVNRLSATTRHAVWLLTLLTIGALPLFAVIAKRNDPATHPATIVRHEQSKPAVQVTAPAFANRPGAERPSPEREAEGAGQFSLDNEALRLNIPANQEKVIRESNPQPQGQEPNPAPRRFDDGARRSTVEEPSASPVATTPGAPVTLDSPKVESQTLWRRMKSFVANSFSGPAPLALFGLWIAICALMSWRVTRS